eukprot:2936607-Prymnesium_polylepis.2
MHEDDDRVDLLALRAGRPADGGAASGLDGRVAIVALLQVCLHTVDAERRWERRAQRWIVATEPSTHGEETEDHHDGCQPE